VSSTCSNEFYRFDSGSRLGSFDTKHRCIGDERDIRSKIANSEVAAEPDYIGLIDGITAPLPEHRQQLISIKAELRLPPSYKHPNAIVCEPTSCAKPKILCAAIEIGNQIAYLERPPRIGDPIAEL
jgi:hypothetical protein